MESNPRRGKTLSTQIPIYTLSGGVGRQAPSKRLPSEAEQVLNALCTVERSIEKRPGTDLMPIKGSTNAFTGEKLGLDSTDNIEFFWHSLSDQLRFLVAIDRTATDTADKLFYVWYFDQDNDIFIDQTPSDQTGIDADVRAYITYGSAELKLVTRGQNLLFLNPDVKAGYTSIPLDLTAGTWVTEAWADPFYAGSPPPYVPDTPPTVQIGADATIWVQVGLDGQPIGDGLDSSTSYIEDPLGLEVTYTTATKVDPAQIAVFYDTYSPYVIGTQVLVVPGTAEGVAGGGGSSNNITAPNAEIYYYLLQAKQSVDPNSDISDRTKWTVIATDEPGFTVATNEPALDTDRTPKQIDVKDWQYPDSTKLQLGQSLPTFNDLTIPPLEADVTDGNNGAEEMLASLYGLITDNLNTDSADGKVYYIQAGYQGQAPGYYLAKSVTTPSFQHVRTPDGYSVIDKKRMPMQLEFTANSWEWSTVEWEERKSGDLDSNPGPSPFKEGRQVKISTMASFRNRLWMAVGDVLFSSRTDDWTDLWIEDPGVITDTDPIDIAASTNRYTPVTAMVPFKEYMFVNTDADTQYELEGSENQITPFTAALQPMTFYSTAPLIDPLTLGNAIFFYDAERLYMYYGYGGTLAVAQELSSHCPKYLPTNFGATAVAAAQDSLLVVDADSTSDIYLYSTKYRGDQILQNAFYQFSYEDADIHSMVAWDNYLYMTVKRDGVFYLERQHLRYDDTNIPRLDRKQRLTLSVKSTPLDGSDTNDPLYDNTAYNAYVDTETITTVVRVPYVLDANQEYDFISSSGEAYAVGPITPSSTYSDVVIAGLLTDGEDYWIGRKFTMVVQLSTQFVRGDDNNAAQGILNIASMETKHFETGNYDIVVTRRGRPTSTVQADYEARDPNLRAYMSSFSAPRADTYDESFLPIGDIEYQGELVSKIMGFSEKVDIFIMSDYYTPVNITNILLRGKFKATYSSLT